MRQPFRWVKYESRSSEEKMKEGGGGEGRGGEDHAALELIAAVAELSCPLTASLLLSREPVLMICVVYDLSPPPSLYTGTVNSKGRSPLLPPPNAGSRLLSLGDASAWYAMVQ